MGRHGSLTLRVRWAKHIGSQVCRKPDKADKASERWYIDERKHAAPELHEGYLRSSRITYYGNCPQTSCTKDESLTAVPCLRGGLISQYHTMADILVLADDPSRGSFHIRLAHPVRGDYISGRAEHLRAAHCPYRLSATEKLTTDNNERSRRRLRCCSHQKAILTT